ncbi:MAG: ABC transporter ATP-binding protein [Limnothrix sp.]
MTSPLQRLIKYGDRHQAQINQAIACSVLNKLFDLAPPVLIGMAVDTVVQQSDSFVARFGVTSISGQLFVICLLSLVIWTLESVFEYFYQRLWRNLAQKMQHELRLEGYSHLQELELGYFEERSTGELMALLNDDINQLERFLDVGANEILQVITTIILVGGIFIYFTPSVAWMALAPVPVIIWGSIVFQKKLAPLYGDVREKVSILSSRLSNNLSGITTIKSFTTEDYELERLRFDSNAYLKSNNRAIALSAAFIPLIRIAILLGFSAILFFGGLQVERGILAVGTYSVLVFMTQRLLWPLTRLGQTLDLYQRAMASSNRVFSLLDTKIQIRSGETALPTHEVRGNISLKNVSFAYSERAPILRQFSLDIPAGKTIAIVGATGSGKSTIVKLLLRFYEISQGEITVDGLDIRDVYLKDLRCAIGLVSQDVFLFHGTVAENIAYGNPDVSLLDIIQAAKQAEAHEFIDTLPQQYDTVVGERGQKLSGGQRQRLAIARAILKDPPILILDEATSAVDNETEAAIARSLEKITQHRTTVAIAHRLSTIRHADCIYVMDRGQIVEQGTHEELVIKRGIYNNLWQVQTGAKITV